MYPNLKAENRNQLEILLRKFSRIMSPDDITEDFFETSLSILDDVFGYESSQVRSFSIIRNQFCYLMSEQQPVDKELYKTLKTHISVLKPQIEKAIETIKVLHRFTFRDEKLIAFEGIKCHSGVYLTKTGKCPMGIDIFHFLYFEEDPNDENLRIDYNIKNGCMHSSGKRSLKNVDIIKYDLPRIKYDIYDDSIVYYNHFRNKFSIKLINEKQLAVTKVTPYSTTAINYQYMQFEDYYEGEPELTFV